MKIFNRAVFQMSELGDAIHFELLSEDSFEYDGAVAQCALGRPTLTASQLQAHVTAVGNISDVIYSPTYDSNTYVGTTGHLSLNFFALPLGQGTTSAPGASGTKTLADTNLTSAGQFTKGNDYFMTGQEILFYPGELPGVVESQTVTGNFVNDVWTVGKSGVLTLTIGSNRTYLQDGPLAMFPPLTRFSVDAALASGGNTATVGLNEISYACFSGQPYTITPVYIEATQGFQEQITWPAAVALPSGNNARIISRLQGYLIRNAQ